MKGEPMSQKPSFPLMKRGDIQSQKEKSHTEVIYPKISPSVSGETGQTEPPGESAFFSFSLTRRASTTKWVTSGSMPRRP